MTFFTGSTSFASRGTTVNLVSIRCYSNSLIDLGKPQEMRRIGGVMLLPVEKVKEILENNLMEELYDSPDPILYLIKDGDVMERDCEEITVTKKKVGFSISDGDKKYDIEIVVSEAK
jgi:hypothetical protein